MTGDGLPVREILLLSVLLVVGFVEFGGLGIDPFQRGKVNGSGRIWSETPFIRIPATVGSHANNTTGKQNFAGCRLPLAVDPIPHPGPLAGLQFGFLLFAEPVASLQEGHGAQFFPLRSTILRWGL